MFESPLDSLNGKLSKNNKLSLFINILRWCHTYLRTFILFSNTNFNQYFRKKTVALQDVEDFLPQCLWQWRRLYGYRRATRSRLEQPRTATEAARMHSEPPLVQRSNKASILSYQSALINIYHSFS